MRDQPCVIDRWPRYALPALDISPVRIIGLMVLALLSGWSLMVIYLLACGEDTPDAFIPVLPWRLARHVEPEHPIILPWAAAVRTVTSVPAEQVAVAEQAVWHLVPYWDAYETWGCNSCIPSIDQMIRQARKNGWPSLRGNCVTQSILLCSLLRSLGHNAWIEATPRHAWVQCRVDGTIVDLLYPATGQTARDADLPRIPLSGSALAAARLLGADDRGRFDSTKLLPETDQSIPYFSEPLILLLNAPLLLFWIWMFRSWDRMTGNSPRRPLPAAIRPRLVPGGLFAAQTDDF